MKCKRFYNDTFPCSLVIVDQPKGVEDVNRVLHRRQILDKDTYLPALDHDPVASVYRLDNQCAVLVIWRTDIEYKEIAHEAVHAATHYCSILGMPVEAGYDEPAAYLVGWVCEKVFSTLELKTEAR